MEKIGAWASIGISRDATIVGLLYDQYSELLVAHIQRVVKENRPIKSLYVRHIRNYQYKAFTPDSEILSYEDAVLSPTGSNIYVNIFQAIVDSDLHVTFDWHSLQKINLQSRMLVSEIKTGEIVSHTGDGPPWIAGIVGIGNTGNIFVRLAIPQETKIRYCLAELNLTNKQFEPITDLAGSYL